MAALLHLLLLPAVRHDVLRMSGVTPVGTCAPARRLSTNRVIFVDGNNLMMQKKVTKGRQRLAQKLGGPRSDEMVLVFDGKPGEAFQVVGSNPQVVITEGGSEQGDGRVSADEWILEQLAELEKGQRAEVVTADKWLRRQVRLVSTAKTINPLKWWRRYVPRLTGLKGPTADFTPGTNADDD